MPQKKPSIGLLGGSFNPVHIGHLRLCLEVLEQAGLDRVDLVPAYMPPHKDQAGILPFDLRLRMLQESIDGISGLEVNPLEQDRPGPSYTLDTLKAYVQEYPGYELNFILGDMDLFTLPQWHRGEEIARLSNLLVIGRQGGHSQVGDFVSRFWKVEQESEKCWELETGRRISFYSVPRLEISSSMIRSRWLAGKSIDWLVPAEAESILANCSHEVSSIWEQESHSDQKSCKPASCR
ncbi:nicotinate (nicotinamide) nucleotide adenylyltransferase [Desulfonatronospira sp.]|uniref:nicotinate (nicotinamide) nucleotide adenylyltransferase n=1 Tax=Desulfonatronospira sp. TaxID=1962951 RepID=UPI0025BEB69D|nr:nicotinate (nicotinamide) nucleotide adenylyltransferase [Desulfonatronospira sp.]